MSESRTCPGYRPRESNGCKLKIALFGPGESWELVFAAAGTGSDRNEGTNICSGERRSYGPVVVTINLATIRKYRAERERNVRETAGPATATARIKYERAREKVLRYSSSLGGVSQSKYFSRFTTDGRVTSLRGECYRPFVRGKRSNIVERSHQLSGVRALHAEWAKELVRVSS